MMASSEALKPWGIHNAHSKSTTMCSRRKSRRPFDIGGRLAAYFPPHGSLPPVHFRSGRLALAGITTAGRMSVSCPHLDAGITGVHILQQYMCTLTTVGGDTWGGKICRTTALRYQMLVGNSSGLAVSRTISKVNCSGITICSLVLKDLMHCFSHRLHSLLNEFIRLSFAYKNWCNFAMISSDFDLLRNAYIA